VNILYPSPGFKAQKLGFGPKERPTLFESITQRGIEEDGESSLQGNEITTVRCICISCSFPIV